MPCPNYTGVLIALEGSEAKLTTVGCHKWDCPWCSRQLRSQWQLRIMQGIEKLEQPHWAFWTLTAHRNATTWNTSLTNLQNGWKRLSRRLRYYWDGEVHYVRVYEKHKSGRAHWHMICNVLPDDWKPPKAQSSPGSRWAKEQTVACGIGYIMQVQNLSEGDVPLIASYLTKYMTKHQSKLPQGTRRVQTSHSWPKLDLNGESELNWTHHSSFLERDAFQLWDSNYSIYDLEAKTYVEVSDFSENGEYKRHERP